MLEFDGQPIDPAIVSAQPMKPGQTMDLPQMMCPPGNPEDNKYHWQSLLARCLFDVATNVV